MAKLKVYRTPIGFHDAYVAAPSQKAALAAWGSDKDLFARGAAEVVDDPALTAEPLAQPGVVIRKLRGTAEEQLAAAPPVRRPAAKPSKRAAPKPPRPDRSSVDAAERALADALQRQRDEEQSLAAAEAELAARGRAMRDSHAAERTKLEEARDAAELVYADALRAWQAA